MKIKKTVYMAIASLAIGLTGCGEKAQAQDKTKIVATHNVICNLVTAIAEDTVDLTCLIGADQDPHTYRPTPTQLKAIEQAQLILYGGYQLEPQVIKVLGDDADATPKIPVYEQVVTEPIQAEHSEHSAEAEHSEHSDAEHSEHSEAEHSEAEHSEAEHSEAEHSEAEHSEAEHSEAEHSEEAEDKPNKDKEAALEPDPHVWHSVENTVAMVELLRTLLLQVNSEAAEVYLKNSVELTEELWQLDAWIKDQVATIPEGQKVLVTTHNSLNYYTQAYRFTDYKSLQGLSSESSATASQVRKLATEIKELGIPTIFAESTASDRVISNVARAADVELAADKLIADGLGDADSYSSMMSQNTCAIVNGLGGKCKAFGGE